MLGFPLTITGRTVTSHEELVELFREDAHGGPLRGQDSSAAQAWVDAMDESVAFRDAVEHVLVELVVTETDPKVLGLIAMLGGKVEGLFPEATAHRVLEGPPLPEGQGVRSATIREDLLFHARRSEDQATRDLLDAAGNPLDVLRMRLDERSPELVGAYEQAVKAAVKGSFEIPTAVTARVAILVAAKFPDELARAAKAAKALPEEHRARFLEEVIDVAPNARATVEAALSGKKRGK